MRKSPLFLLAAFAIMLVSCKKNSVLSIKTYDVDYLNKTADVYEGKNVMEIMGADNIIVFDTLIMVETNNPDGQLEIYSSNTMRHLGTFCKRGRARNEFFNTSCATEQCYYRNGHIILAMFDVNSEDLQNIIYTLKEVDITESLLRGSTVVLNADDCMSNSETLVLGNDFGSRFQFELPLRYEQTDRILPRYTVINNGDSVDLKIFNKPMETMTQNKKLPYSGNIMKHPSRNLVVQSFYRMDYLLYMDIDADNYFMVHQKGALTFDDTYVGNRDMYQIVRFTEAAASSEYLMYLYRHGDYTLSTSHDEFYPELLVFDWDGNYITGFKINLSIHAIEYDEIHKVLYGLDRDNEILYAYDMSHLLP